MEKEGTWDAIIEVTNEAAREAIENNDIPFYVSPRAVKHPDDPLDGVKRWAGLHLAIVDKPAFGEKASVKGMCEGDFSQCNVALSAKEDCGFCVKSALLKLVTNSSLSDSSLSRENENSHQQMSAQAPTIDTSKFISKEEYETKVKALEIEAATYKQANADLSKNFNEFKASIEEEKRTAKITNILSAKIADAKVRDERIKYFVDAKVAPEVVETAYKDIPDVSKRDNSAQFTAAVEAKAQPKTWLADFQKFERRLIK